MYFLNHNPSGMLPTSEPLEFETIAELRKGITAMISDIQDWFERSTLTTQVNAYDLKHEMFRQVGDRTPIHLTGISERESFQPTEWVYAWHETDYRRMKLSYAMRKGLKYHPQGRGGMFIIDPEDSGYDYHRVRQACAMGSAFEGYYGKQEFRKQDNYVTLLNKAFPEVASSEVGYIHPVTGSQWHDLYLLVTTLNDRYDWSRSRIVRWLMSQGL